ncbi:hypothetical protein BGX30_011030, partial [Mortierella sp. GBA39]
TPTEDRLNLGGLKANIKRITDKFFAPGSDVTKFLDRFVQGLENLPLTTGAVSGLPTVKLRNKGRPADTHPSLLFSGLPDPSSSDTQSRYPTSDAILKFIERCSTSTVPIFGVSGCGKTRGMIELLSRCWGFYFNAAGNDLGSDDITTLISHIESRLQEDREANNRQARTMTYLIFLSRLKTLQYCLTIPDAGQAFTSARWTILQTCPHVFNNDVFGQLFRKFLPLLPRDQTSLTELDLMTVVQEELQATKHLLVQHGNHGGLPAFQERDKLMVVHDEAQILGDTNNERFESMSPEKPGRPLLSPVLHGFRSVGEDHLTLITCGTGLSMYTLDWARSSGSAIKATGPLTGDLDGFEYMEFPGWTGRESIEAYVAGLRYLLPTNDAKQALDRLLPSEAVDMMMERLVGRFRPIVTVIERVIASGEPGGWEDAVDDTEARLVSYDFRSVQGNICNEIRRLDYKCHMNMSMFRGLRNVKEVLSKLLFQRYMFGNDRLVLMKAEPELVERSVGRIKIIDGVARTVLDEPFVLKAAENFFKIRDPGFTYTTKMLAMMWNNTEGHAEAWKLMMLNVFIETFKTGTLSDWPHEPSILSQSAKLAGTAVIVGLDEQGFQRGISHKYISMKSFMHAHVHSGSMRNGRAVPPFFFPNANLLGPDIVFCIRVNEQLFPVFVQLKLRLSMAKPAAKTAFKAVSAPAIEAQVKNLVSFCPTDNTYISMVIAYPAKVVTNLRPRLDPAYNLHPRPDPKHKCLEQVTVIIDKNNIDKIFPQSHIEFLDMIKTLMKQRAVAGLRTKSFKRRKM